MTWIFLRKEFRQHGLVLGILTVLTWGIFLLIVLASGADGSGGGTFFGIGQGLSYFLPIPVFIVCHLFIAVEFRRPSRLFLEGLPLPRWRMIAIKGVLSVLLAALMSGGAVLAGAVLSAGSESIAPRFLGILLSSATVWASFLAALFFLVSFLGRYKVVVILVLLFALSWIAHATSVPLRDFPPFALIHRFGFERELWPEEALWRTGAISLGLFALAFLIGLAKEGSVAAILGEQMSHREKMFLGSTLMIVFTSIMIWVEPQAEPFDLPGAVAEEVAGARVHLSPDDRERPVDEEVALASYLARRIAEKRDWLGIPPDEFPPVYIVERSGLEDEKIEWEYVDGERVVLIFAGYREPGFSRDTLLAYAVSLGLSVHSHRRVDREHRWWIVCGVEGLIEMENADEAKRQTREKLAFDTVMEHGLSAETLLGRNQFAEEAGWREADAVAWMAFRHLAESRGMKTVRDLARKTVTRRVTRKDSRPSWRELFQPVPRVFEATTGISLDAFAEGAHEYILAHPGTAIAEEETE